MCAQRLVALYSRYVRVCGLGTRKTRPWDGGDALRDGDNAHALTHSQCAKVGGSSPQEERRRAAWMGGMQRLGREASGEERERERFKQRASLLDTSSSLSTISACFPHCCCESPVQGEQGRLARQTRLRLTPTRGQARSFYFATHTSWRTLTEARLPEAHTCLTLTSFLHLLHTAVCVACF